MVSKLCKYVICVFLVLIAVCVIILNWGNRLERIVEYSEPLCQFDNSSYEDGVCMICGKDAEKFGRMCCLERSTLAYDYKNSVKFSDIYNSWDDYENNFMLCYGCSIMVIISLMGLFITIMYIIWERRDKKNGVQI